MNSRKHVPRRSLPRSANSGRVQGVSRQNSRPQRPETTNPHVNKPSVSDSGRGHSSQPNAERSFMKPIPYKVLETMFEDTTVSPQDLALRLSTESSGFYLTLKQDMREGMTQMVLKVLAKVCSDDTESESVNFVLQKALNSKFHEKASTFLHGISSQENHNKRNVATHIRNSLCLLRAWMTKLPLTSRKQVSMLKLIVENAIENLNLKEQDGIMELLTEVQEIWNEFQKPKISDMKDKKQDRQEMEMRILNEMHLTNPPEDFRTIPVFPQQSDINSTNNPFVRCNLVSDAYQSKHHYLDVQYRLLREDFVRPLREGIKEYLTADPMVFAKSKRIQNIKVYNKVKIEYPYPGPKGMLYCIHFDPSPLKKIRWQSTKRLMYGNLICLSSDKFEKNLLFATVAQRDPEKLGFGYLNVEFVHSTSVVEVQSVQDSNSESSDEYASDDDGVLPQEVQQTFSIPDVDMHKEYTMVETEAYFEAYRHVLAGLQEIDEIPLERYLLRCQRLGQPPKYLRDNPHKANYKFSTVFKDALPSIYSTFDVLDEWAWPNAEDLSLDKSQKEALINALTREMAIIQGPPGTGKTYIGLIIMKLMLANNLTNHERPRHRMEKTKLKHPILVVCYTNHALDQFLEGIAEFQTDGIVRVGGRCKNKNLEKYTLMQTKRRGNYSSSFSRKTIWNLRGDMKRLSGTMMKSIEILDASTTILLNLETIQHVIPVHIYNQFEFGQNKNANITFIEWLGVMAVEKTKLDKELLASEILSSIASRLHGQFHLQHIYDSIFCTQSLNFQLMFQYMCHTRFVFRGFKLPPTEMIVEILKQTHLPFMDTPLKNQGYKKEEIACAFLVTGSPDLQHLQGWLDYKSKLDDTTLKLEQTEIGQERLVENDEFQIEEEAALLQEQRILIDDEPLAAVDRRKEKERQNLINQMSAATFENIEENVDPNEEGWQLQNNEKKRRKKQLKREIGKTDAMSTDAARRITDVFKLSREERWSLYRRWVADFRLKLRADVEKHILEYNRLAKTLQELQRSEDRNVLQQADVIGITTTGAAKYRDIINKLPVKVVIVEEAAEVLEAHIVTSMPETTEHLILIGDHQQLKPSPTVYELAVKYNLEVSLFERMIKNGSKYARLQIQHRMRPNIADLLRIDIYPDLVDHFSVKEYENICGVQKNVFFITHEHLEESVADGRSKINQHEADYMVSLCQYLMCQGYNPGQITILAAYTGQLFAFKRIMKSKLHAGVRVTAVDNFQGEENDIILLSLVRSNKEENIGFLKVENRVCVALSRAKKGLYCIGNFTVLQQKSGLWRRIVKNLEKKQMFATSLPLQCKNHPDYVTQAATATDFNKVPEGGCGKPCEYRLPCGHCCARSCHPDDEDHSQYKCRKPCPKSCEHGHKCRLMCHQKCGSCKELVTKIIPSCYHSQQVPCYQNPESFQCQMPCTKTLDCDHKCAGKCSGPCTSKCMVLVKVNSPCGHETKVPCYLSLKVDKSMCKEKCDVMLSCEHYCKGTCVDCFQGRVHVRCKQKCNRVLICGHTCKETCAMNCPPCTQKCTTQCEHSKCKKGCREPCIPCTEKCRWSCKHFSCSKLCSEPCDRPPCNLPCPKNKPCGHPCIGLCGEPCPKLCRVCDKDKVTEIFFGDEDEDDALFVQLNDCKHIFTYQGLDQWMNQSSEDTNGDIGITLKECPRCKAPIRRSRRYGNIVNKQIEMINVVKMKLSGNIFDVAEQRKRLQREIAEDKALPAFYKTEYDILYDQLHEKRVKTLTDVHVAEVKYNGLQCLAEIKKDLKDKATTIQLLFPGTWKEFNQSCERLRVWVMRSRFNFSKQETGDVEQELMRLKQCAVLFAIKTSIGSRHSDSKRLVDELEELLFNDLAPYCNEKKKTVKKGMKMLKLKNPGLFSGLGISDDERKMIVSAMNLSKGHWYKCKNGHIYCIGECGGATERSKCPECGENIGGVSHRLDAGNQLAGEMDNATTSAFDPGNMYIPPELRDF